MCAQLRIAIEVMVLGICKRLIQASQAASMCVEDAVGEPVRSEVLPDVLDRVELRGARRQEDRRCVFGHVEVAGRGPSGAIEQQHGVGALVDMARDFIEVELHRLGVGVGHGKRRSDAAGWADGAEQVGVVVALVSGLARPGSAFGPLPDLAVLFADAGLVLKPDFDRRRLRQAVEMGAQRAEKFF
jgi:hypothetical protein